jgi:hypothetical protein
MNKVNEFHFTGKLVKKEFKQTKGDRPQEYGVFCLTHTEVKEYNGNTTEKHTTIDKFNVWNKPLIELLRNARIGDEIETISKPTSFENDKGYHNLNFTVLQLEVKSGNYENNIDNEVPF